MAKVNIDDVLQGLIQPIGALKGGFDHPVTSADQIWVYTDPSTPVPLDEYLDNLETSTSDITGFFVSNATALTDGKITKASIVGGDVNKCKVGDIVLVADGGIYKIKAIDETNITLVIPALASYATASACVIKIDSKKNTYTSNIPLPWDKSIPVYTIVDGYLRPLVYEYQSSASGHYFERWGHNYTSPGFLIAAGFLKPDGTVEPVIDRSMSLLVGPAPGVLDKSYLMGVGPDGEEAIEIGDNLTLIDGVLSATGDGSGGNVSSRLNLMNDDLTVRISITAEELKNIKKGLYNSVLYMDDSLGADADFSLFFPENAIFMSDEFFFSIYKVALKETGSTISASIVSSYVYELLWDKEAADGTYPITINRVIEASSGGGEASSGGIYFHSIHIIGKNICSIFCNYYSNYPHHYTLKTFKDHIWAKPIACSGFVEVDGKQYAAVEIERTSEQDGLDIWYFDGTARGRKLIANTDQVKLYDERVFNVATGEERDPPPEPR